MWDAAAEAWYKRTAAGDDVQWNLEEEADAIPDWVWDMSGIDKPSPWGEGYCNEGCPITWIGDNICDQACLVDACNHDEGDCDS